MQEKESTTRLRELAPHWRDSRNLVFAFSCIVLQVGYVYPVPVVKVREELEVRAIEMHSVYVYAFSTIFPQFSLA